MLDLEETSYLAVVSLKISALLSHHPHITKFVANNLPIDTATSKIVHIIARFLLYPTQQILFI